MYSSIYQIKLTANTGPNTPVTLNTCYSSLRVTCNLLNLYM